MSYSDLIRSDRTPGQRAQDDEDHRLALCGLSFDARADEELKDFRCRHYDFIDLRVSPPSAKQGPGGVEETPPASGVSAPWSHPYF